jgi:hypothetical protein
LKHPLLKVDEGCDHGTVGRLGNGRFETMVLRQGSNPLNDLLDALRRSYLLGSIFEGSSLLHVSSPGRKKLDKVIVD